MNILFLLQYYKIGGVETVTHVLANQFAQKGHHCCLFSLHPDEGQIINPPLSDGIDLITLDIRMLTNKQVLYRLREELEKRAVDVIINQSGHILNYTQLARRASYGLSVKVISVLHNTPDVVINRQEPGLRQKVLNLRRRWHLRRCYMSNDAYVLLSPSFIPIFQHLTRLKQVPRLSAIANPVTTGGETAFNSDTRKEKMLLYVGRLDQKQKRVDRILAIWKNLEPSHPDWQLCIVGDGPDRQRLEAIARNENIQSLSFEGFQAPDDFYRRAAILLLTSDYEGFPLVLAESMSYGVIPIVYGSYPAVYDIIHNGTNGFISAPKAGTFDQDDFTAKVRLLIDSEALRKEMSEAAWTTSQKFSPSNIYTQWETILR